MVVLSANKIILLYKGSRWTSLTKMIKSNGPKQLPWAVPYVMLNLSDFTVWLGPVVILATKLLSLR